MKLNGTGGCIFAFNEQLVGLGLDRWPRGVHVMTRLIKDRLCIKMTFMHNGCWVDHYEKCSRH